MNINFLLTGLISLLIGLIAQVLDKPLSAREKRDKPFGYTEAHFKYSKWTLIIGGALAAIYGLFYET